MSLPKLKMSRGDLNTEIPTETEQDDSNGDERNCSTVTLIAKPDSTPVEDGIDMACVRNSTKTESGKMSGRGNQGKRPASLQEELPGTVAGMAKLPQTETAAATAPVPNSNGDSQGAGIDGAPDTTRQEPQQQGNMSGRGKRPASPQEELPGTVAGMAKLPRTDTAVATTPEPNSSGDSQGAGIDGAPDTTRQEPQQQECRFCKENRSRATTSIFKYDANDLIKEKKGDDCNSQRLDLKKKICAMLNSQETGILVFHADDCHILDIFHQTMDDEFEKLIPDGSSYADTFDVTRPEQNHFCLRVKPRKDSKILSTLDFHTTFSLNRGVKRKCGHYEMQTELEKAKTRAHHSPVSDRQLPKDSDFKLGQEVLINGDTFFQENKYLQAKAIGDTRQSSLIELVWDKHNLGNYISAFSKLAEGGTVLFGIREETYARINCQLKQNTKFICEGVGLKKSEENSLKLKLKENIDALFWVALQTNTNAETSPAETSPAETSPAETSPATVDFLRLPDDSGDRCIIRTTVHEFNGICFLRKNGPESYELDKHGKPIEIQPWSEWAKRSNCADLVHVKRPFELRGQIV